MSDTRAVSEAVTAIEEKAARKEQAENIDQKVTTARRTVSSLNSDISELTEAVRHLQFYRQILAEMFEEDVPRSVKSALDEAEAAVQLEQSAIVNGLVESPGGDPGTPVAELQRDVSDAKSSVKEVEERVKDIMRAQRNAWRDRLSSARELQGIIGEQNDEFARTVEWIEEIIENKIWNPDSSASAVVREWENATDQWRNHQDLQGLDAFQQTHDLSDDAIGEIEKLSASSDLTLADVDIDVLRELKSIEQLAEAVNLSI